MDQDFWLSAWDEGRIGFHQADVHPRLIQHFHKLKSPKNTLVPLCGKSLDMTWIKEQGSEVMGVELSSKAIQEYFFQEKVSKSDNFFSANKVSIYHGDFLDFSNRSDQQNKYESFYDRASIVALPPKMRQRYVDSLLKCLCPGARGILISLEYDQSKIDGPPFSISEEELKNLFRDKAQINILQDEVTKVKSPRFKEAGLKKAKQKTYLIELTN